MCSKGTVTNALKPSQRIAAAGTLLVKLAVFERIQVVGNPVNHAFDNVGLVASAKGHGRWSTPNLTEPGFKPHNSRQPHTDYRACKENQAT